ncbi:hypothetical protein NC651_002899 [Populus alba x Populus x berolinensis]|nr:hypothetical protein NC651_002899 [Populus alba x Populus x berolinensis]
MSCPSSGPNCREPSYSREIAYKWAWRSMMDFILNQGREFRKIRVSSLWRCNFEVSNDTSQV